MFAIIPARGGSKGIPGKNIKNLCGKPLIAHTISSALSARCISRVFVSTDDAKIAEAAREYGAEIIERPVSISGDEASSESALIHALQMLRENGEVLPEYFAFLQCTCPLTSSEDIDHIYEILISNSADSAFTAKPSHDFRWQRGDDGEALPLNHNKHMRERRQDRQIEYIENGAVYVLHTEGFLEAKHRFFGRTVLSEMPASRCLDIDVPEDLLLAEALIRLAIL